MLILVPIAFAAGVITAFTPCILPVLPIVLAGGGTGTTRRPYAIAAGLVTTFTAFLLAGAWLWSLAGIDAKHQIRIGAVLLLALAVTLVVPQVGRWVERPFLFLTRRRAGDLGGGLRFTASFRQHAQTIRIAGGVLMAAAAVVIYQGWAEDLQTKVPGYAKWVQDGIEGNSAAKHRLDRLAGKGEPVFVARAERLASRLGKVPLKDYGPAPGVSGISAWINTAGLSLPALRGKVVLVDFWTYSCINCLRTLPHLEEWDARYRSKGLVILGVHSPEFGFEHDLGNVRAAVKRLHVRYPVALDNKFETWNAYGNQYWPADYLIDQAGHVRDIHFGEGNYDETERAIRLLLEAGRESLPRPVRMPDRTPTEQRTPESYLGYSRIAGYAGSPLKSDTPATYRFPPALARDSFAYSGIWTVEAERIVAGNDARLRLQFHARTVHLVLGGRGVVGVTLNGAKRAAVRITGDRLYTLLAQKRARDGLIELSFTPGLAAYAFTFG